MERDKAGGMLAASGSHYIDLLRWWFGDIKAVAGLTATMVPQRHLPDSSEMAHVDADDNFALMLRFQNGAIGTIHVCATAASDAGRPTSRGMTTWGKTTTSRSGRTGRRSGRSTVSPVRTMLCAS